MSDEREMLACSLPPEDGSPAVQFEQRLLPKGPGCPVMADLILLAEGKVPPDVAPRLQEHLEECETCLASFQSFQRALEPPGALVGAPARAPAQPAPASFTDPVLNPSFS